MSLHIREPLLPPNHQDGGHGLPTSPGSIQILHPAYDNGASLILSLQGNDTEMGGLALSFALDCCSIVTGNRSDGWLSRHRDPKGPSVATDITILQPNEYYLHLPQRPEDAVTPLSTPGTRRIPSDRQPTIPNPTHDGIWPYPIVPTFRDWSFPATIPTSWHRACAENNTPRAALQSEACYMTLCKNQVETAHIVEAKEWQWFKDNDMPEKAVSRKVNVSANAKKDVNHPSNLMRLRRDIHKSYDQNHFCFAPKPSGAPGNEKWHLCAHCLEDNSELQQLYHNVPIQSTRGLAPAFFYARFAATLFPVSRFLEKDRHRWLTILEKGQKYTGWFDPDTCRDLANARPASTNPTKRKQTGLQAGPRNYQELGEQDSENQLCGMPVHKRQRNGSSFDSAADGLLSASDSSTNSEDIDTDSDSSSD